MDSGSNTGAYIFLEKGRLLYIFPARGLSVSLLRFLNENGTVSSLMTTPSRCSSATSKRVSDISRSNGLFGRSGRQSKLASFYIPGTIAQDQLIPRSSCCAARDLEVNKLFHAQ